jgi:hypothetical protein
MKIHQKKCGVNDYYWIGLAEVVKRVKLMAGKKLEFFNKDFHARIFSETAVKSNTSTLLHVA